MERPVSEAHPPVPAPAPSPARIRLHVGTVVLDGIDLAPGDRGRFRAALEGELGRLLAEGGVHPAIAGGGAYPRLRAANPVDGAAGAAALGRQVAHGVYGEMGR
jgi:hypothetical protein